MNFVEAKPKLATTAGILYSRAEPPPELPLYARTELNNAFESGAGLVTPCQSMANAAARADLEAAFPIIQEFFAKGRLAEAPVVATTAEDYFGFGGAVVHPAGGGPPKLRSNSVATAFGADDSSSLSSAGRGTASTTSAHNKKTQYHKTKLCPWHKEGKCFMGSVCNYAHSRDELKPKPDLSKTKLCPEVVKHKVCDRPGCRFAHDYVELRATSTFFKTRLCKFWQRGYCPAGPDCRHAHGKDDLRFELEAQQRALLASDGATAPCGLPLPPPPPPPPPPLCSATAPLPYFGISHKPVLGVPGSPSFISTTAPPTPLEASPSGEITPLYIQCAAELLSHSASENEVVQLLRRLAGEDLLPEGLLDSPVAARRS